MQEIIICDCLWADILSGKKTNLLYKGKREFDLISCVLSPKTEKDMRVVRITKVFYDTEKDLTIVDFKI